MFERFTDKARSVVTFAQDEARMFKHTYIGTEHLLLGLLRVPDSLGQLVLVESGVEIQPVRDQVRRIVGEGSETPVGQIPFTPRAKKILELSLREALSLGNNYIGTEHVLLGLVRENEGVAARILQDKGIEPAVIRDKIGEHLRGRFRERVTSPSDVLTDLCQRISTIKDEALDAGLVELASALRAIERDIS